MEARREREKRENPLGGVHEVWKKLATCKRANTTKTPIYLSNGLLIFKPNMLSQLIKFSTCIRQPSTIFCLKIGPDFSRKGGFLWILLFYTLRVFFPTAWCCQCSLT